MPAVSMATISATPREAAADGNEKALDQSVGNDAVAEVLLGRIVGADGQPTEIGAVAAHPLQERARITPERNAVMDQAAAQDSWNDDY